MKVSKRSNMFLGALKGFRGFSSIYTAAKGLTRLSEIMSSTGIYKVLGDSSRFFGAP